MLVCDVSDSFDCLPQFKVLARESRDKNEKYRYKMEVKNGQIVGEDGEVEKLAMVQTKICLLSKVYSSEACFKLKAQKQRAFLSVSAYVGEKVRESGLDTSQSSEGNTNEPCDHGPITAST
ncbi:hypothetical protein NC652_036964 [Populus alba x Populus x berolinensis]|nr:hypothetical protein NC652_036964 [Populus alba x Populus x berolinensis]